MPRYYHFSKLVLLIVVDWKWDGEGCQSLPSSVGARSVPLLPFKPSVHPWTKSALSAMIIGLGWPLLPMWPLAFFNLFFFPLKDFIAE